MLPVHETKKHNYVKTKVVVKFEAAKMVCRTKSQKAMKCVHIAVRNVKIPSSYVRNTPQPCRQSTILRSIINYVKIKVVIKFKASDQDDVCRIKTQKAMKCAHIAVM